MSTCPTCDRPESNGGLMCRACTRDLTKALDELPGIMRDLNNVIRRETTGPENPGKSTEIPMPYDWSAAHDRDDVRNTLTTWIRELNVDDQWPADNVRAMCNWLVARIDRMRMHVAVKELHDEILYCVKQAERGTDIPSARAYYGRCDICEADLYGSPTATEVACRKCWVDRDAEVIYPTIERKTGLWKRAEDQLVPRRVVLNAFPVYGLEVDQSTFRSWVNRGTLVPKEYSNGTPLYLLREALELARAERAVGRPPRVERTG